MEEVGQPKLVGKKIIDSMKKTKHWHHDIKYIDGRFVEDVVADYQVSKDEDLLKKIINNYAIYRNEWARAFSAYLDNDIEAGAVLYENIIWKAAEKFKIEKALKAKGKAFNAFVVSAHLNQLKNFLYSKTNRKNHPRVTCPICKEEVYQIDEKHLAHVFDFDMYKRRFSGMPLMNNDGSTAVGIRKLEDVPPAIVAKVDKETYGLNEFRKEFEASLPKYPVRCPVTGMTLRKVSKDYPSQIMAGYTEEQFIADFPNWEGVITCPFTGNKYLEMTSERLDEGKQTPAYYLRPRKIQVTNPYTGEKVDEITPKMLGEAGTTIREHLEKHASIVIDKVYPKMVICPFNGRPMYKITPKYLSQLGKTVMEFYMACCSAPLFKYQVRCAVDGEWIDNAWSHLKAKTHYYAEHMTFEQFERHYGNKVTKIHITTNSYVESDSGDMVHISDLLVSKPSGSSIEIEDSLIHAAGDDMDKMIARSLRDCSSIDDVQHVVSQKKLIKVPANISGMKSVRDYVAKTTEFADFDVDPKTVGERMVTLLIPSKTTIMSRLERLVKDSDIREE